MREIPRCFVIVTELQWLHNVWDKLHFMAVNTNYPNSIVILCAETDGLSEIKVVLDVIYYEQG